MKEQTILECVGVEETPHLNGNWWVQIALGNDLVIVGIHAYRQSNQAWNVTLPVGIKIRNPVLLAALREVVIESVRDAILKKRLAYLKEKQ